MAERTFQVLDGAGLTRIAGAPDWSWDDLVARLEYALGDVNDALIRVSTGQISGAAVITLWSPSRRSASWR